MVQVACLVGVLFWSLPAPGTQAPDGIWASVNSDSLFRPEASVLAYLDPKSNSLLWVLGHYFAYFGGLAYKVRRTGLASCIAVCAWLPDRPNLAVQSLELDHDLRLHSRPYQIPTVNSEIPLPFSRAFLGWVYRHDFWALARVFLGLFKDSGLKGLGW